MMGEHRDRHVGRIWNIYFSWYGDLCWQGVDSDIAFKVNRIMLTGCGF